MSSLNDRILIFSPSSRYAKIVAIDSLLVFSLGDKT